MVKPNRDGVLGFFGLVSLIGIAIWMVGSHAIATDQTSARAKNARRLPHFIGAKSCAKCHQVEHREWLGSHHAASMQTATETTVLGRFDGRSFMKDRKQTTFFRKGGEYWIRTEGPDRKISEFKVHYTFGVTPLQQYLLRLPGGRLQAFDIAWDTRPAQAGGQRWYHLYPDKKHVPGDPLHWTGIDQNWNYQCAWCHSTNLAKNYNPATRSFKTKWSEINVACEACHGPASSHLAWASKTRGWEALDRLSKKGFDRSLNRANVGSWRMGSDNRPRAAHPVSPSNEIRICAGCHSRRGQFSAAPRDVSTLFDAFRPARLEAGLYHADGQQQDEVYKLGSFLQSRMHAEGVTCSNCHNPHSGKLRQKGNGTCTQCHVSERYDTTAHHHHPLTASGAKCTACHMPATTYMGVDARHDHSIRIPRPDRSLTLATPNTCNRCHSDKTAKWTIDKLRTWFPKPKLGAQSFAEAFDLGDRGAPGAQAALARIAQDASLSGLVRASAITRLSRYPSRKVLSVIARLLKVNDPEIRSAAVEALSATGVSTRRALLTPLLRDPTRLVRMDAAHALAGDAERGLTADDRQAFERAIAEYISAQRFNAERAEAHFNLGSLYQRRGKPGKARSFYKEALAIDPTFHPASISLSELERLSGDERAGEAILSKALEANPTSGALLHALGLSLARQKRMQEATEKLSAAARSAPEMPRFAYVYAILLHDKGKPQEALDILNAALKRHPYNRNLLSALISYEIELSDIASALSHARLFAKLEPDRSDIGQVIKALQKRRP
jgi:tetratricopeptide (TPR) repeat protein